MAGCIPLGERILSMKAETVAGLAVQARTITELAGDLWDGDLPSNESHERQFIEAVCAFVGVTVPGSVS
jgi:hypothetical protein